MTTKTTRARKPAANTIRTIKQGDVTVGVANEARSDNTVSVLFRSRRSQKFFLSDGRSVTINGNAVYLAGADGGALPAGGYGVTTIDKADWDEIVTTYGVMYRGWFESGKLKIEKTERKAIDYAHDNADDDAGDNPVEATEAPKIG